MLLEPTFEAPAVSILCSKGGLLAGVQNLQVFVLFRLGTYGQSPRHGGFSVVWRGVAAPEPHASIYCPQLLAVSMDLHAQTQCLFPFLYAYTHKRIFVTVLRLQPLQPKSELRHFHGSQTLEPSKGFERPCRTYPASFRLQGKPSHSTAALQTRWSVPGGSSQTGCGVERGGLPV